MRSSPPSERPAQILVVDDELENIELFERVLRLGGYGTIATTSPREALGHLEKTPSIRVVFSDLRMPEMNGLELLERVQRVSPDVTRVMISGHADAEALVGAINGGAVSRWISKPVDTAELLAAAAESMREEPSRLRIVVLAEDEDVRENILASLDG